MHVYESLLVLSSNRTEVYSVSLRKDIDRYHYFMHVSDHYIIHWHGVGAFSVWLPTPIHL